MAVAYHLLKEHTPAGQPELQLAADAYEALRAYGWLGSLRKLAGLIIRGAYHIGLTQSVFACPKTLPPVRLCRYRNWVKNFMSAGEIAPGTEPILRRIMF